MLQKLIIIICADKIVNFISVCSSCDFIYKVNNALMIG